MIIVVVVLVFSVGVYTVVVVVDVVVTGGDCDYSCGDVCVVVVDDVVTLLCLLRLLFLIQSVYTVLS